MERFIMQPIKLFCISFLTLVASAVYAEPAQVSKFDSGFLAFDGSGAFVVTTAHIHQVETNSKTGIVKRSVRGQLEEGSVLPTNGAVHFETFHLGLICSPDTPYFKYVLTPSGKFHETCRSEPFN
jgi:hypothetical protein